MSIGQRLDEDELSDVTLGELYRVLGERQTPELLCEPYTVNTEFSIPFGAGNSLGRKTVYVDHDLYEEVMDGEFAATGLEPDQIIDRWTDHEHCEVSVADGDNAVDIYFGCHRYALRKEHEGVLAILGRDNAEMKIGTYERVIWPGLQRCYKRPIKKVPADLWCAPLRDNEDDPRADELLKRMRKLGVIDAGKRSKYETHYGISGRPCRACRHWHPDRFQQLNGDIADCDIVGGLARENRHCDFFKAKKETGKREDE